MISETELLALIDLIYQAAVDVRIWPDVLARVSDLLDCTRAALVRWDVAGTWGSVFAGEPFDPQAFARSFEFNPLWPATLGSAAGSVLLDRSLVGRDKFLSGAFFNEFCVPHDLFASLAVKVRHEPSASAVLCLGRPRSAGEFEARESALMSHLAPHLLRAVEINQRLAGLETELAHIELALERLAQPAIIVDADSRIRFANRAARELLASADGLSSDHDGLRAATPRLTGELRGLIARAAAAPGDGAVGSMLALARASLKRPLSALVTPLSVAGTAPFLAPSARAALVLVADPERTPTLPPERLRRLYRLTRTEATVALAVASGDGLQTVADRLGVARPTVATHLARIFEKTGTRRQAELVRLVLQSGIGRFGA
jgi:DNA-binding CsgD family transcriptional regulator/PAS domain-containing protein